MSVKPVQDAHPAHARPDAAGTVAATPPERLVERSNRPLPAEVKLEIELCDAHSVRPDAAERKDLHDRSISIHPFQLGAFEDAALGTLVPPQSKRLIIRDQTDGRLVFSSPVTLSTIPLIGRHLRIGFWKTHFAPLGGPMVDADYADTIADRLPGLLQQRLGIRSLEFPYIRTSDPFTELLLWKADRNGWRVTKTNTHARAALLGPKKPDPFYAETVPKKRRKEYARLRRRLADQGTLAFETLTDPAAIREAFETFVVLEASGWKGTSGSALRDNPGQVSFARQAVHDMADQGVVRFDQLTLDGRPVAQLIRFVSNGEAVAWKMAHDTALNAFSPGLLLMIDVMHASLADPAIRRTDSLAVPDHPMINLIWRDALAISNLNIAFGWRGALGLGIRESTVKMKSRIKALLHRMIRRR